MLCDGPMSSHDLCLDQIGCRQLLSSPGRRRSAKTPAMRLDLVGPSRHNDRSTPMPVASCDLFCFPFMKEESPRTDDAAQFGSLAPTELKDNPKPRGIESIVCGMAVAVCEMASSMPACKGEVVLPSPGHPLSNRCVGPKWVESPHCLT